MTERMKRAETLLKESGAACVLITKESRVLESGENGVRPLMEWLRREPSALNGACAADKVVGKAAALLMAFGGVSEVYAEILSEAGEACLQEHGIPYSYGGRVPYIQNRQRTGMCPMEQCCAGIDSPAEAYESLGRLIASMNRPKN